MPSIIFSFWYGNVSLWKSYWLVGELLNALVIIAIINVDIIIFNNSKFIEKLPFLYFNQFHIISKFIIITWSIFITVGIWRSAENYKGNVIWIILALTILCYRIFTLRTIFL